MANPAIHHITHCLPQIVPTGISTMELVYASLISLALGAGIGFLLGRVGISGIKADIAEIKAKISPAPVVVATPVVAVTN